MSVYWNDNEEERRENLCANFFSEYGRTPEQCFSAPGRTELLGAYSHFDYGTTLSCALSRDVICAAEPRQDGIAEIRSEEFPPIRFSVYDLESREREKGRPVALFRGVLGYLRKRGYKFGGFSAYIGNTIDLMAGPCAALEALVSELIDTFYLGGKLSAEEKVCAGQYAENVYFGKAGGFSEQIASVSGGVALLDLSSGQPAAKYLQPPEGYTVLLIRAGGENRSLFFEKTRKLLNEDAAFFGKRYIKDVPFGQMKEDLNLIRRKVSDGAVLCAFDYFEENERARLAGEALLRGDKVGFLSMIKESGLNALCGCFGERDRPESPVYVAMKMSEYLIKDGACNLLRGTGTVVAVVNEEEAQGYFRAMARLFGRENVLLSGFREQGAGKI